MIRKDYLNKLGEEKERFISNLKAVNRYNERTLKMLNKSKNFYQFNEDAFEWEKTPQGYEYWHEIAKR
jgi:hypothetical protein